MLPFTQAGTGSHASVVAFHLKAGAVHAQLVWPTSALLVLYPAVAGHARQLVSPRIENWPAPQAAQTTSLVAVHAVESEEPAAQVEQGAHGEVPEALHVKPAAQPATEMHACDGTSQK